MILDHIPQGAALVVIASASSHTQILGYRDLNTFHKIPVPQRFENRIGEALDQKVLDSFLT